MPENWKEFIKRAKEDYYKIGSVPCSAFGGEIVYFEDDGFYHLIHKGNKFRSRIEQTRRVRLVKKAPNIIRLSSKFEECKNLYGTQLWSLVYRDSPTFNLEVQHPVKIWGI